MLLNYVLNFFNSGDFLMNAQSFREADENREYQNLYGMKRKLKTQQEQSKHSPSKKFKSKNEEPKVLSPLRNIENSPKKQNKHFSAKICKGPMDPSFFCEESSLSSDKMFFQPIKESPVNSYENIQLNQQLSVQDEREQEDARRKASRKLKF